MDLISRTERLEKQVTRLEKDVVELIEVSMLISSQLKRIDALLSEVATRILTPEEIEEILHRKVKIEDCRILFPEEEPC